MHQTQNYAKMHKNYKVAMLLVIYANKDFMMINVNSWDLH